MPLCEGQNRPQRGAEVEMSCGIFMIILGVGDNGASLNSTRGEAASKRRAPITAETKGLSSVASSGGDEVF